MLTHQGFYASSLWERPTHDDACEEAANELGKILTGQAGENLLLSGDLSRTLAQLPAAQDITGPLWVQYEPEMLTSLYQLQAACGATGLLTETAACTSNRLAELQEGLVCQELCDKAARAAYAVGPRFVIGTMSSAPIPVYDQDSPAARQVRALYTEQARALVDAQVHALFITGMTNIEDAVCAVHASRLVCSRPLICALDAEAVTSKYHKDQLSAQVKRLVDVGADAVGISNVLLSVGALFAACLDASDPVQPSVQTLAQDLVDSAQRYGIGTLMTICPDRSGCSDSQDSADEQAFLQLAQDLARANIRVIGAGKGSTAHHTAALSAGLLAL